MGIVGGFDIHRRQITFDYLDERSGESRHGRIAPADRMLLRRWLQKLVADTGTSAAFAVEGCTGWRFVVEELQGAGIEAHLAEPADTAAARAETAGQDRPHRRPAAARPARRRAAARVVDPAGAGAFRCAPGCSCSRTCANSTPAGCSASTRSCCTTASPRSPAACSAPTTAAGSRPVKACRRPGGRRWPPRCGSSTPWTPSSTRCASRSPRSPTGSPAAGRCRPTTASGAITAAALWSELGDSARFSASRKAVRHTGLDITVHSSDGKRTAAHLSRQGSPLLRWALFEAAQCAARPGSPDHAYYRRVADRIGGGRATLSVARKMVRRAHHTLRALGEQALAPA